MDSIIGFKICDSTRLYRIVTAAFGNVQSLLEQGNLFLFLELSYKSYEYLLSS